MFWRNTYFQIAGALMVFLLIGLYFPEIKHDQDVINIILSMATFTFAIVVAFSMSRRHSRLSSLRQLLRANDATFIDIYHLSKAFGAIVHNKVQKLIDNYVTLQLDYELDDFRETFSRLAELQSYIVDLQPKNDKQNGVLSQLIDATENLTARHKEIEHIVQDRMLGYEWGSLIILPAIIWFSLLMSSDQTPVVIVLIALLSTSFVLLLGLLQDLDNLTWQQRQWIWLPLTNLFLSLDLLPYIPEDAVQKGRISFRNLEHLKEYRLAKYRKPYPDFTGKKIKIIENK